MPSGKRGYGPAIWGLAFLIGLATAGAARAQTMELTSRSISSDAPMARKYAYDQCDGSNISPDLSWSGAPKDTKSFALTMHDPDAPAAGGWWHWIVIDIPSDVMHFDEGASGSLPAPILETSNDFRRKGYGGPCPPRGADTHRYVFTLYALDVTTLSTGEDASPAAIEHAIESHAVAEASLTARYGR